MSTTTTETKAAGGLQRAMATFVSKKCKAERCGECNPDEGRWPCTHDCHKEGIGADDAPVEAMAGDATETPAEVQDQLTPADDAPESIPDEQVQGDEGSLAVAAPDGPAPTFAMLPIDRIVPSADNPRRHLDVTDEMVDSVRAAGILEPLVVERCDDVEELEFHGYHVIAGHRRLEAAERAGLTYVPCVVREPMEGDERIQLMLIENLQRADLVPLDEARGYEQLVELGLTQRDIAERVGCNQSHVSRRLALRLLPQKAQDELDAGGITLEEATALARMHREPKRIEAVLKDKGNRKWALERQLREFETEQTATKTRAQLKKDGVPIVEREVRRGETVRELGDNHWDFMTVEAHGPGEPVYLCLDENNHPDALAAEEAEFAEEQRPDDTDADEWKAEQERRRAAREAEDRERTEALAARRAVVQSIVDGKLGRETAEFVTSVFIFTVVEEEVWADVDLVAELLGIEIDREADAYDYGEDGRAVGSYAAQSATNRQRAALAAALSVVEGRNGYGARAVLLERHLGFLCDHGYVMHKFDEDRLARARKNEEPDGE